MSRGWVLLLLAAGPAAAQEPAEPLRFRWQPRQVLTYTAEHVTRVAEVTLDDETGKPVTDARVTKLRTTRRWEVKGVDPAGVATLELTVPAVRQEIVRPGPADKDGNPTLDRTVIDSATDEGRQLLGGTLNKPVVTVKVDSQGRLIEATAAAGTADRWQAELPFRLTLPDAAPVVGGTWDRAFPITTPPPLGTGEKYDATQTYTFKGVKDGYAVVGVATALKNPPKDPAELPPLVGLLWEGEVYFQPQTGRYAGCRLTVKREVVNHQGEGTKYVYQGEYTEALAEK
jgi:hypothetical protein